MHELSWKSEYKIGHPLIDREHKHLFEIALEAFVPVAPELRKKKIRKTILELNEYMKLHFMHEESFMRVIEYPDFNHHLLIHQGIIKKMQDLIANLASIGIKEFEKDLAHFIEVALVGHILQEDTKIQKYYEKKKSQRHVIHWHSSYLVGQEDIDNEHQMLFKIANEAFADSELTIHKEKVKETIIKLALYVQKHFDHEESYMLEIGYPQLKHHCEIHGKIIDQMNQFIKEITTMDIQAFELELAIFIEKWIVQHILHEDKKIKHFLDKGDDIQIINLEEI
ncbi:bacteriohemerythrin [Candidatus Sulfurimonas baltica]|uniref:Bacteriohemerythrin n=1 Tax=Candidatus Sulfurimonas baltica TaxID=2740404 RepID=A0A7S7RNJ9_9BACT|nr:bacteriohemerythrin [Candidatus Sulfurimonas baltica]QOY52513.1 bacteriohemerythrin [Candidatus Sulfurimonas baltica]